MVVVRIALILVTLTWVYRRWEVVDQDGTRFIKNQRREENLILSSTEEHARYVKLWIFIGRRPS